jgi:hypothetical protein
VAKRVLPYLVLAGLGLLFFAELVLHPGSILYSDHSDFVVQALPSKHFLIGCWREDGELPLWNPYSMAGMPFVHDIQVAAFYPPDAILYLVPEKAIGPAMSWLLVAHVVVAGWGAFTYARTQGLNPLPALVTGLGTMFAGKWMLHLLGAGHYNFAPLAWLPWVVLLLEQGLRWAGAGQVAKALLCAAWGGAVFGVLALGAQPQLTFYAGLFLVLWTLGPALESVPRGLKGQALLRWAGIGTWAALWAVGVFAVQLLPTAEATRETTRAVSGAVPDRPLAALRVLTRLVGPSLAGEGWDDQGGFGLLWLVAAVLAPVLVRGRIRFQAGITLALALLAVVGPFLEGLPLLNVFRVPARLLLIAGFPVSLLAGATTQALFCTPIAVATASQARRVALGVAVGLACAVGLQAVLLLLTRQPLHFHPYWAVLVVLIPAALLLARKLTAVSWHVAWVTVLLIDLWALGLPLVAVRPEAEVYAPTASVKFLAEHAPDHGRVLDRDAPARPDRPSLDDAVKGNTPLGYAQPLLRHIEAVRGLNPIDVYRYKRFVQFISDRDEPIEASGGLVNFEIRNRNLLDLLGTRYLLQPSALKPEGGGWGEVERDSDPVAFGNIAGDMQHLPPYTLYENRDVLPRAFIVPIGVPLAPTGSALARLRARDFRRVVLLEGVPEHGFDPPAGVSYRPVPIVEYLPNTVTLDLQGAPPGWLVLTDVWFPGWTCTVDGRPTDVYRADYVFRAVSVPSGAREVVFRFAPASYRSGRLISVGTVVLLAALSLAAGAWLWRRCPVGACS